MTTLAEPVALHFTRGVPPAETIPARELAEQTARALDACGAAVFQYAPIGHFQGDPTLRAELGRLHGAEPERIFVGNGSLQVLDLVASHLLRAAARPAYVEAPTYDRAIHIFRRHGARVVGIPMEHDGMDVAALARAVRRRVPAFVYTIPDFQNPGGATLSAEKRRALVELTAAFGFLIIEDVPYRALRYHGAAPPTLAEIAEIAGDATVIMIGSLSKVLSPGLRIGYAVSDRETSRAIAGLAENTYLSPAPLNQAVAARCLAAGLVTRNAPRACDLLRPRHDAAVRAVRDLLGDALLAVPDGGYFLAVHLPVADDEASFLAAAQEDGLTLTAGSAFYPPETAPPRGTLFVRLPFQALEPPAFALGVERLATLADELRLRARHRPSPGPRPEASRDEALVRFAARGGDERLTEGRLDPNEREGPAVDPTDPARCEAEGGARLRASLGAGARELTAAHARTRNVLHIQGLRAERRPPPAPYEAPSSHADLTTTLTNVFGVVDLIGARAFAYGGENDGRVVRDVVPHRTACRELSSQGWAEELPWHMDCAFRPLNEPALVATTGLSPAPRWLVFGVVYDTPPIPITFIALDDVVARLGPRDLDALTRPAFDVRSPASFAEPSVTSGVPILVPDGQGGYFSRFNATKCVGRTSVAAAALGAFASVLESPDLRRHVRVARGDVVVLDNWRSLHMRPPFTPRWDGTDRWFLRVYAAEAARAGVPVSADRPRVWA